MNSATTEDDSCDVYNGLHPGDTAQGGVEIVEYSSGDGSMTDGEFQGDCSGANTMHMNMEYRDLSIWSRRVTPAMCTRCLCR